MWDFSILFSYFFLLPDLQSNFLVMLWIFMFLYQCSIGGNFFACRSRNLNSSSRGRKSKSSVCVGFEFVDHKSQRNSESSIPILDGNVAFPLCILFRQCLPQTEQGGCTDLRSTEQFVDEYTQQTGSNEELLILTHSPSQWGLWIVSAGQTVTSQVIKQQLLHLLGTYQPTFTLAGLVPFTSLHFPFGFLPLHVSIFFPEFFSLWHYVFLLFLFVCFCFKFSYLTFL